MKRLVVLTTVIAALILTVGVTSYARTALTPALQPVETPKPTKVVLKYETGPPDAQELLELVNKERVKAHVAPLQFNLDVQKSAQLKADDFAKRHYYSHLIKGTNQVLTPQMNELLVANCSNSSENIAADMLTSADAFNSTNGWLSSTPHKKAILNPKYTSTGFGVSYDDGDYYVVEHFCVAK